MIVNAPQERVFKAFLAWERQGLWIPLTTVRVVSGDGGEGSMIEAITSLGPAILRDEMRVEKIDKPYEVKVVHCGRILRGPGVMRCTALTGNRTQLVWHEWFQLPAGLAGRMAWPVMWPGSKLSLTYASSAPMPSSSSRAVSVRWTNFSKCGQRPPWVCTTSR